jgi:hypothetical protein
MANKKTLKDYFNEIIALAEENGRDDLVEFAKGRIEVLNKKTARKPSKTDEANAHIKEVIVETLSGVEKATVSELIKLNDELRELSNQKVSALLRQLVETGKVEKFVDKKKSYFSIVA